MAQRRSRGFTLVEMAVVVAIVAIMSVGVALGLRTGQGQRLDSEAERLGTLLELAADESRVTGRAVIWMPTDDGYRFVAGHDGGDGDTAALDARLGARRLAEAVTIERVEVDGGGAGREARIPFVAGTLVPFRIRLRQGERGIDLVGRIAGRVERLPLSR